MWEQCIISFGVNPDIPHTNHYRVQRLKRDSIFHEIKQNMLFGYVNATELFFEFGKRLQQNLYAGINCYKITHADLD